MKNTGVSLEKTVARIQQMMDPNSKVTHNEFIMDRVGNRRQYDVVIRGQFAGREILGVIECKDHKRKKGPETVEAFAKKSENLNANLRVIVSSRGFTDQALKLAKHEGIGCLSLLPDDPKQVGFSIGDTWYGRRFKWGKGYITLFPSDDCRVLPDQIDSRLVMLSGQPVLSWFEKELFSTYDRVNIEGNWTLSVRFSSAIEIEIDGIKFSLVGIACTATRLCQCKKQWVTWSGDAFFDWQMKRFTIPPSGCVIGSQIDTTLEDWDDFDGVFPEPGRGDPPTLIRGFISAYESRIIPEHVLNLEPLIAEQSFSLSVENNSIESTFRC